MKHIAAFLLLTLGGNASPSASDVKGLLDTVGIEADESRLEKLVSELQGKDITQVSLRQLRHWQYASRLNLPIISRDHVDIDSLSLSPVSTIS